METVKINKVDKVNSIAEDLFVQLFSETFGPDKTENLFVQYPFVDIYGNHRFIDFALKYENKYVAIEIDGETYHNPKNISENKYYDDLLKQNSLIHSNWKVYRWAYNQLTSQKERVKDELLTFLGDNPYLNEILPKQQGKVILFEHQEESLKSLEEMRKQGETIGLLYHATGIGKTYTAVSDAKKVGGRTLFVVNSLELIEQAKNSFKELWSEATVGVYSGELKEKDTDVIIATIQSLERNIDTFKRDDFEYIIFDECHHASAKTYKIVLEYFTPNFILGLTATPERMDGEDILELFKNVAHKMDLKQQ